MQEELNTKKSELEKAKEEQTQAQTLANVLKEQVSQNKRRRVLLGRKLYTIIIMQTLDC